jgi:L-aspartate oxidase
MKGLPAETDFVVIGAGVAGLRAAIELASAGRVLVLVKDGAPSSSSDSSLLSDEEEVILHLQDTLITGDGLCNPEAVKILEQEAVERLEELISWGQHLEKHKSTLIFESEARYKHSHVLRSPGQSVADEVLRVLQAKARASRNITVKESEFCTEL